MTLQLVRPLGTGFDYQIDNNSIDFEHFVIKKLKYECLVPSLKYMIHVEPIYTKQLHGLYPNRRFSKKVKVLDFTPHNISTHHNNTSNFSTNSLDVKRLYDHALNILRLLTHHKYINAIQAKQISNDITKAYNELRPETLIEWMVCTLETKLLCVKEIVLDVEITDNIIEYLEKVIEAKRQSIYFKWGESSDSDKKEIEKSVFEPTENDRLRGQYAKLQNEIKLLKLDIAWWSRKDSVLKQEKETKMEGIVNKLQEFKQNHVTLDLSDIDIVADNENDEYGVKLIPFYVNVEF